VREFHACFWVGTSVGKVHLATGAADGNHLIQDKADRAASLLVRIAGATWIGRELAACLERLHAMSQSIAHRWNFGRRQRLVTSRLTAVAVLIGVRFANSLAALAQSQTPVLNPRPTFEVASIKPNQTGERPSIAASTGGMLRATNETLKYLIQWAYNVQDYQISGGRSGRLDRLRSRNTLTPRVKRPSAMADS